MARKQPSSKNSEASGPANPRHRAGNLPAPTPITPVPEKIGEDKDNLKARAAAFKRRRGPG